MVTANPYLSAGFEPVVLEEDRGPLRIEGTLPPDLNGVFYRIGPNPQFAPRGPYNPLHGDGMVHAVTLRGGAARCRNRWVRTRQWTLENAAGRSLFGAPGIPGASDPSVEGLATDGAANTNIVWHAGRLLALEEGHAPIEMTPETLETIGPWTFGGALPCNMTAHPKVDPATGEMLFFANFPAGRFTGDVAFYQADAAGALQRTEVIAGPIPALMHDFAITEDFVIFPFCPVTVSVRRARAGGPALAWEPELGTHLGVMPRRGNGGDVRWFAGPPCMTWHVLNAFNDGGRIIVDVCAQDAPMFPNADGSPPDPSRATQRLTRWELDWERPGAFEPRRLSEERCEYPRIDERRTGRPYRYGYVSRNGGPGSDDLFHRGMGRFDHAAGEMTVWDAGPLMAVAEPVFVARSVAAAEGDGYLLSNVFDEAAGESFLAILDAREIEEGPIAKAHVGARIPVGFHANWVADGGR